MPWMRVKHTTNPKIGRAQVIFSLRSLEKFESGKSWKQSVGTEIWSRLWPNYDLFYFQPPTRVPCQVQAPEILSKERKMSDPVRATVHNQQRNSRRSWETSARALRNNCRNKPTKSKREIISLRRKWVIAASAIFCCRHNSSQKRIGLCRCLQSV